MKAYTFAVLLLLAGPAMAQTAESIVQKQVDAYNAHDVQAFADVYADNVEFFDLGPAAKPTLSGRAALVAQYKPIFEKYKPIATITSRTSSGAFVVDHERVGAGTHMTDSIAVYQVENGKIRRVWVTP